MNPPHRPRLLVVLLVISASINLLGAAFVAARVARGGGLRYILERLDLRDAPLLQTPEHDAEVDRFRALPDSPGEIVFAGDSQIAFGPWSELYSNIKNRGIKGERSGDLLARIDEVASARPSKVFLLIGTNDLAVDVPPAQTIRNLREILVRLRAGGAPTRVYLIGVLPVNQNFPGAPGQDNGSILDLNERIKALAKESPGVEFIDLSPDLVDAEGNLRRDLTQDGLHLTLAGYLVIGEKLRARVLGDAPAEATAPRP